MKKFLYILAFVLMVFMLPASNTNSVILTWCPSGGTNVFGYKINYGAGNVTNWVGNVYDTNAPPCPGVILSHGTNWYKVPYTNNVIVIGSNTISVVISNLLSSTKYYFSAVALDINFLESLPNNEMEYYVPDDVPPTNVPPSKVLDFRIIKVN